MQIDMPAERRDHRNDTMEGRHVRHATEMAHEIEAAATKTALLKFAQAALGYAVVDIGDRAIGPAARGNRVQRHAVVGAMYAGIDDDGAPEAELGMERPEIRKRRIGRRIGTPGRVGIFVAGAKDMG